MLLVLSLTLRSFAADPPAATNAAPGDITRWLNQPAPLTELLSQPLTVPDVLNLAEAHNAKIVKAKKDLETQYGIAVQTRAIVQPRVRAFGQYGAVDEARIEVFGSDFLAPNSQSWSAGIEIVQSIYEGGRIQSSLRSSRLLREQALFDYQTVVADTLLNVRVLYDDVLLATNEIIVREASVELLSKELQDTKSRFEAGVVAHFNVLRAEVELANARPPLIRARNNYRIAKQRLVNELGINLPRTVMDDVPIQLAGRLTADPYVIDLPAALAQALESRTELTSVRRAEELGREGIRTAKAGTKPSFEVFAGYGAESKQFGDNLGSSTYGWETGARFVWHIFDGQLTKGKVMEARARHERTLAEYDDLSRRIELEVRTTYSKFIEAKEVLESQQKVNDQAVEALRLANSRYDAGTGTQLDVLSAQTALTDARTTYVEALHAYSVARWRLERAMGKNIRAIRVEQP